MKKHIVGLALFSVIVSTAAVIYALFPVPEIAPVSETVYVPQNSYTKSCWKMQKELKKSRIDSPVVAQAVFNMKTKNLIWELSSSKAKDFPILHFFVRDEKGVRLLDSIRTAKYFTDGEATKFSNRYSELNKLSSQANLYLILDTTEYSEIDETEHHIMFDIAKAIPVTIDYGE